MTCTLPGASLGGSAWKWQPASAISDAMARTRECTGKIPGLETMRGTIVEACFPKCNRGQSLLVPPCPLLPLDRRRRLAGNVVDHAVDPAHFVDDAVGDFREQRVRQRRPARGHDVA